MYLSQQSDERRVEHLHAMNWIYIYIYNYIEREIDSKRKTRKNIVPASEWEQTWPNLACLLPSLGCWKKYQNWMKASDPWCPSVCCTSNLGSSGSNQRDWSWKVRTPDKNKNVNRPAIQGIESLLAPGAGHWTTLWNFTQRWILRHPNEYGDMMSNEQDEKSPQAQGGASSSAELDDRLLCAHLFKFVKN